MVVRVRGRGITEERPECPSPRALGGSARSLGRDESGEPSSGRLGGGGMRSSPDPSLTETGLVLGGGTLVEVRGRPLFGHAEGGRDERRRTAGRDAWRA